jgi:DNA-binding NtrC family response regulator
MIEAIKENKFREDLYYRLNTVEIHLSPLRERRSDIHLLFRKFASDFALKYKMPTIRLTEKAVKALENCSWPGNIRQLKNVTEQISVLETEREVDEAILSHYLPRNSSNLPSVISEQKSSKSDFSNEREILYKVLFDMKNDLNDLKKLTMELMENGNDESFKEENINLIKKVYGDSSEKEFSDESHEEQLEILQLPNQKKNRESDTKIEDPYDYAEEIEEEETLSLQDKEVELIKKSLNRHQGKRKPAADELGISERTLYRKIKQYDL